MEAGKVIGVANIQPERRLDLIDAMIESADDNVSNQQVEEVEQNACPTCGSCSGMFTANSMNCLTEALGLALPGNGTQTVTEVAWDATFEGTSVAFVGTTGEAPFRVYALEDPTRLVVEVADLG